MPIDTSHPLFLTAPNITGYSVPYEIFNLATFMSLNNPRFRKRRGNLRRYIYNRKRVQSVKNEYAPIVNEYGFYKKPYVKSTYKIEGAYDTNNKASAKAEKNQKRETANDIDISFSILLSTNYVFTTHTQVTLYLFIFFFILFYIL